MKQERKGENEKDGMCAAGGAGAGGRYQIGRFAILNGRLFCAVDQIMGKGKAGRVACASWLVCENALPMQMLSVREISACVLCLGGRLLVCTVLAAGIFWLLWHRSERYRKALAWLKRL